MPCLTSFDELIYDMPSTAIVFIAIRRTLIYARYDLRRTLAAGGGVSSSHGRCITRVSCYYGGRSPRTGLPTATAKSGKTDITATISASLKGVAAHDLRYGGSIPPMGTTPKWYEFWSELRPMARSLCVNVPAEVSASIGRVGQVRVRISVNGTETHTLMLQGPAGSHFVKLSASFRKTAGIREAGGVSLRLALAEQDPPFSPPPDLHAALQTEPTAMERWDLLPYRHKKGHVDYIAGASRPESRERRIRKIVEALAG
jgi:hypothetical protein